MEGWMNFWYNLNDIKGAFEGFSLQQINLLLVIAGMVYIAVWCTEQKKPYPYLWQYTCVMFFMLCNPFAYNSIRAYALGDAEYCNVFFLIPAVILISYVMVQLLTRWKGRTRWGVILGIVFILVVSVNLDFSGEAWKGEVNQYKSSDEMYELGEILQTYGDSKVLASPDIMEHMNRIDTGLYFAVDMQTSGNLPWEYDLGYVISYAREQECAYTIVDLSCCDEESVLAIAECVNRTEHYMVVW